MFITDYSFGSITIGNKTYHKDIIIIADKVYPGWRRHRGHHLSIDDLTLITDNTPETIVIGTGKTGLMQVPRQVIKTLEEDGNIVYVKTTGDAVKTYNNLRQNQSPQRLAAALHLTC
ncbi:MAG: MTH938/NDUFAF3 family protein [Verrucomicrobiota bacterium]